MKAVTGLIHLIILSFLFFSWHEMEAQSENSSVDPIFILEINDNIFPAAWRQLDRALDQAEEANAGLFLLKLNTYGGAVHIADSMRSRILRSPIKTAVLIDNNAASAGALISIACDSIFMVPGAMIGAATVVDATGAQLPDKYQSYMRATMRSTAEHQGRDPKIAEAMVDDRIYIPGVIDSTKTLTFTTQEAIKNQYCDAEIKNLEQLISSLGGKEEKVISYKASPMEGLISFLLNPAITSALLIIIFAGIYFELQSPGVGFPILASMLAAILYFAPHYLEGLAENWEILMFFIGLSLLVVEVFVLPGTGIAGVLGGIFVLSSILMTLLYNQWFDFTFTPPGNLSSASLSLLLTLIGSIVLIGFLGTRTGDSPWFKRIALQDTQNTSEGFTVKDKEAEPLISREAEAITDLKISGMIEVDGRRWDAITNGEFIEAGSRVKIIGQQTHYFIVKKIA